MHSYKILEKIDHCLKARSVESSKSHWVPISSSILYGAIIHGAADNFDKNDKKEGSHDTILMLFQNYPVSISVQQIMSHIDGERRCSKQDTILKIQKLIPSKSNFKVTEQVDSTN